MADTRVQHEVEDWVRGEWLPKRFGQSFDRERLELTTGGQHNFAAVSANRRIVAKISTGSATTASGNLAVGKLMKLRADMLFLTMVDADRKCIIFTEPDMHALCTRERELGRVPEGIELLLATLPAELHRRLDEAKLASSREVRPSA